MKKITLFYIVALLFTSVVWGAVTDIVVGQRAGANQRYVQRVVTGSANTYKPLGFGSDGVLGAISQIRGATLGTPDGLSNIDITTNGTIRITADGTNSINTSTRKLFNSSGTEVFDWNANTLSNNWSVTGNLRVGSEVVIGTAMAANVIDTSKALNTKTLTDNATLTFSTTPTTGQVFGVEIKNTKASAITVTIPSSKDYNTGATVTSILVPATPGRTTAQWRYDGTDYIINQGSSSSDEVLSSTTSVTDRLVSFTDTTGRVIKDSGETATSLKSRANHTGTQAWNTITGTPTTLGGYGITDSQPVNTNLSSISLLSDPNVDRLLFWDDSSSLWRYLTLGTNLAITDTTLNSTATSSQAWSSITGTPTTLAGYGITNAVLTGVTTNQGTLANTANAMSALAIDVTKELNTKTVTAATTFTFSGTPGTNQWFGLYVKNTGESSAVITFPSSKDSVTGATITTSTIAATIGRQHLYWRYDGTEYIIYRGSSGGAGDAQLSGGNSWTGNQSVTGSVTATTFSGDGTLLDNIPGTAINGPIPDIEVDILTTDNARIIVPTAIPSSTIDVTKGWSYKILTSNISIIFSDTPTTGTILWVEFICDSVARVITLPLAVYSDERGTQVSEFTVQANSRPLVSFIKLADGWRAQGIPTQISNLTAITSPETTASIEIDQGTGSRRTTLANIKTSLSLDTSRTGTHAVPNAVNPLSPTWTGPFHTVYTGVTGTINLPIASAYTDKGIIIYNTGAYLITIDANGSEVLVRDGNIQTGGVSFTLSTGAGNFVNLISDGSRWITLGYKGTLTQGS